MHTIIIVIAYTRSKKFSPKNAPQQQALALFSVSMDNIMSFNIDVDVMINDLITSGESGQSTHQRAPR